MRLAPGMSRSGIRATYTAGLLRLRTGSAMLVATVNDSDLKCRVGVAKVVRRDGADCRGEAGMSIRSVLPALPESRGYWPMILRQTLLSPTDREQFCLPDEDMEKMILRINTVVEQMPLFIIFRKVRRVQHSLTNTLSKPCHHVFSALSTGAPKIFFIQSIARPRKALSTPYFISRR